MRGWSVFSCVLISTAAFAQTPSVSEIEAQINKDLEALNEYQVLLNHPEPARSLRAMQIMMASGDPDLERMALEFGLFSPNPQVRHAALAAFFKTQPVLEIIVRSAGLEIRNFGSSINNWNGTVSSDGNAFLSFKVGEFVESASCYAYFESSMCFIRLSENSVSINTNNSWSALKLDDAGNLVGAISIPYSVTSVPVIIPVTR